MKCTDFFKYFISIQQISPGKEPAVFLRLTTYMIPMVLQILIPCYFGNEVSISSEKLSVNLFHSEWFKENKKFTTAMKLFMENTKHSIVINAAEGLFRVNLGAFLRICNFAYSVYAVLERIN